MHVEVDARDYSFEENFLDAMCIPESEAPRKRDVKTDIELDSEEGLVAGADGVGVGGCPQRARGSGEPDPVPKPVVPDDAHETDVDTSDTSSSSD